MTHDRRLHLLARDLRAALDVPEAAGPGVVEWLRGEIARVKQHLEDAMIWHGYEQHPDAHPERPWWRRVVTAISETPGWQREPDHYFVSDDDAGGEYATEAQSWEDLTGAVGVGLSRIDAEHPLPAPEPKCGQVWVWPLMGDRHIQRMITSVFMDGPTWDDMEGGAWPPSCAVLVAGPGSPWAPPGYAPAKVDPAEPVVGLPVESVAGEAIAPPQWSKIVGDGGGA